MWFLIKDTTGQILHNNLPSHYDGFYVNFSAENQVLQIGGKKLRHGVISNHDGSVYAITDDPNTVKRPRYFKEMLRAHLTVVSSINRATKEERDRNMVHINRLIHNIETINGHSIQELFDIVSEEELRQVPTQERKALIQNKIKERIGVIHKTILNLIKNNTGIKIEFALFQNLLSNKKIKLSKQPHQLKRALMNVAHNFFQDFHDKNVRLNVLEYDGVVFVDYSAFQSALFQVFDNATKYTLPDSDISITFEEDSDCVSVVIKMISLEIKPEEAQKITQEWFCGEAAKKSGLNGDGIGMFAVQRTLQMTAGTISVEPRPEDASVNKDGLQYQCNVFVIKLPRYRKQ